MAQRLRKVRHLYGLTPEEYLTLVVNAGGRCQACGQRPPKTGRVSQTSLHVDHDHETGEVRGLICYGCNLAIGYLQECPDRARSVANYLEATRSQNWNDVAARF